MALAAVAVFALTLAGCGDSMPAALSGRPAVEYDDPPPPTETTVASQTDAAPGTTTTTEPLPGLYIGAVSPAVLTLEQKLEKLHYWAGQVDEAYDVNTRDAVMAFQKVTGMDRTGRATDDVLAAVNAATPAAPMVPDGGPKRVEIDLDRQVLFLIEGNNLATILPVSTGSNERFCSEGWCRRAVTPPGSFQLYSQVSGWEKSPLGWLYNSQYFNGGIAIHGSQSVPNYPASHGCVRISMTAADWFPDRMSVGMPVYVVNEDEPHPAPVDTRTSPTSTPTTIVPDTSAATATTRPGPTTTTTAPNLLGNLLAPPTTARP
ncbi:MAG: L,D-transpeptidase family protein [Acidimicrobiales bacterium]